MRFVVLAVMAVVLVGATPYSRGVERGGDGLPDHAAASNRPLGSAPPTPGPVPPPREAAPVRGIPRPARVAVQVTG